MIILIVFIPVLSLSGVEGKMFRPMALSFSFALLGAMFFGLTWLPVASALFLRPEKDKPFAVRLKKAKELVTQSVPFVIENIDLDNQVVPKGEPIILVIPFYRKKFSFQLVAILCS